MVPVDDAVESPPVGSLADLLEGDRRIRDRLREKGCLIVWVNDQLVGIPTMAGIALNCDPLRVLAQWWCTQQSSAKSPSVTRLKKEVLVTLNLRRVLNQLLPKLS